MRTFSHSDMAKAAGCKFDRVRFVTRRLMVKPLSMGPTGRNLRYSAQAAKRIIAECQAIEARAKAKEAKLIVN